MCVIYIGDRLAVRRFSCRVARRTYLFSAHGVHDDAAYFYVVLFFFQQVYLKSFTENHVHKRQIQLG